MKETATEFWEGVVSTLGLALLKAGVTALLKYRQGRSGMTEAATAAATAVVCVEVPPAISQTGGTLEVHWVGAARVQAAEEEPKEEPEKTEEVKAK